MRRSLQVFLGLFGTTAILIASLHIVLGPSAIPGSIPVNATMDSEDRFYATLFGAYGVALLWCIGDIERKSRCVYFLAATFFAGGLARVVSILAVGPPNAFFLAMTVLELVIPAAMLFVQTRISNPASAHSGEVSAPRPRP
jgi:hypothetical protein